MAPFSFICTWTLINHVAKRYGVNITCCRTTNGNRDHDNRRIHGNHRANDFISNQPIHVTRANQRRDEETSKALFKTKGNTWKNSRRLVASYFWGAWTIHKPEQTHLKNFCKKVFSLPFRRSGPCCCCCQGSCSCYGNHFCVCCFQCLCCICYLKRQEQLIGTWQHSGVLHWWYTTLVTVHAVHSFSTLGPAARGARSLYQETWVYQLCVWREIKRCGKLHKMHCSLDHCDLRWQRHQGRTRLEPQFPILSLQLFRALFFHEHQGISSLRSMDSSTCCMRQ